MMVSMIVSIVKLFLLDYDKNNLDNQQNICMYYYHWVHNLLDPNNNILYKVLVHLEKFLKKIK